MDSWAKSMLIMGIEVKNLNKLLKRFEDLGYKVVAGSHAVLLDGSELGIWRIYRGDELVAELAVHYVDAHYEAIMNLPPDVDDREFIRALIEAEARGLWRAPVEPVIFAIYSEEVASLVSNYIDDYENEAAKRAVEHYLSTSSCSDVMRRTLDRFLRALGSVESS